MNTLPLTDFLRLYAQAVQLRAMRFPRRVYLGEGIMWEPRASFWQACRHPVAPGPRMKSLRTAAGRLSANLRTERV